jgi:hypothetical protein
MTFTYYKGLSYSKEHWLNDRHGNIEVLTLNPTVTNLKVSVTRSRSLLSNL